MATDLSDSELRHKLINLGVTVGPITDTTRALYFKKLSQLIGSAKKATRSSKTPNKSNSQLGFSSDDSEPIAENVSTSRASAKRRKSKLSVLNDAANQSTNVDESKFKKPEAARSRRSLRKSFLPESPNSSNGDVSHADVLASSPRYDMQISDSDTEPAGDSNRQSKQRGRRNSTNRSSERNRAWLRDENDKLPLYLGSDDIRPRTSTPTKRSFIDIEKPPDLEYPSLNYVAALREQSIRGRKSYPGINGHRYVPPDVDEQFATTGSDSGSSNWPQKISSFLLLIAVIFFVAISLVYIVGMKQWNLTDVINSLGPSTQERADKIVFDDFSKIKGICNDSVESDCVKPANAKSTIQCCHKLFEKLSIIAGKFDCNETSDVQSRTITRHEALKFVHSLHFDVKSDSKLLTDALTLLLKNEDWGVKLVSKDYEGKLFFPEEVWWLESKHPFKSFTCRIYQASYNVVRHALLGFFILTLAFAMFKLYTLHKMKKSDRRRKVFALAEQIIGILKIHHNECKSNADAKPYIPVTHVRDMIIPLEERHEKNEIWEMACKAIEDNESRVRVEYQVIAGEDNQVWRWLDNMPSEFNCKVWQGRAFENDTSSLNALSYTAFPCLKIRNMFSPEKEMQSGWKTSVIDAVMEKCGDQHEIVHIAIANDSSIPEGCVYVKFRSSEAARRAYDNLHGWWFDGKLVTVKFLRQERYHEHYPESRSLDTPLKPSNDLKLSLSRKDQLISSEVLERS